MTSVRKSLLYTFASANTVAGLQFATSLVIARLLSPAELGIYSVAAVFIGIAQLLRDLGAPSYVVQAPTIEPPVLRAAFAVSLVGSWTLAAVLALASSVIADFYGEPRVREIMLVLSLNFVVSPFGVITLSVANREMRFRATAAIGVAGAIVSSLVAIFLAAAEMGPVSLAWGAVAGTTATFLLSLKLRRPDIPWLPSFYGCLSIVRFGSPLAGSGILRFLSGSSPELLLGRLISMEAVGLYGRAAGLDKFMANSLNRVLAPVLLPWLSKLVRESEPLREAYSRVSSLVTGVLWPAYLVLAITAEPLILVLFGDQWTAAARLVPYFALGGILRAPFSATWPALVALGKPMRLLGLDALNLPVRVVAILLSAPWGVEAVAMTVPFVEFVGSVARWSVLHKEVGMGFRSVIVCLRPSLIVAVAAGLPAWLTFEALAGVVGKELQLLSVALVAALSWVIAIRMCDHPIGAELDRLLARMRRVRPD